MLLHLPLRPRRKRMREACGGHPPGHGMLHGADACILGSRCWHLVARTLDVEGARGTRGAGVSLSAAFLDRMSARARARPGNATCTRLYSFIGHTFYRPATRGRVHTTLSSHPKYLERDVRRELDRHARALTHSLISRPCCLCLSLARARACSWRAPPLSWRPRGRSDNRPVVGCASDD